MEIIKQLHQFDTIEGMTAWTATQDENFLRRYLLRAFDTLCHYEIATEWNDAVRVCEALAIIGWGDRPRVDALTSRMDSWRQTAFRGEKAHNYFREASFLPRKAGWYLMNYMDNPGPDQFSRTGGNFIRIQDEDIICTPVDNILSQRNYFVEMQFGFIHYGDLSDAAIIVVDHTSELSDIMKEVIAPSLYASRLEAFHMSIHTGRSTELSALKIGQYHSKRKAFYAELNLSRKFLHVSATEQRLILSKAVRESVQAFLAKLKKRKLDFPAAQFEADVNMALMTFAARGIA